jgi:hypothetical protein
MKLQSSGEAEKGEGQIPLELAHAVGDYDNHVVK